MVLICFYVSVYLMDAETKMMEESNSNNTINPSTEEHCRIQDRAVDTIDTILLEETVVVNPTTSTITHGAIEYTKWWNLLLMSKPSQKMILMVFFQVLECFLVYCLTVSQQRKPFRNPFSTFLSRN